MLQGRVDQVNTDFHFHFFVYFTFRDKRLILRNMFMGFYFYYNFETTFLNVLYIVIFLPPLIRKVVTSTILINTDSDTMYSDTMYSASLQQASQSQSHPFPSMPTFHSTSNTCYFISKRSVFFITLAFHS